MEPSQTILYMHAPTAKPLSPAGSMQRGQHPTPSSDGVGASSPTQLQQALRDPLHFTSLLESPENRATDTSFATPLNARGRGSPQSRVPRRNNRKRRMPDAWAAFILNTPKGSKQYVQPPTPCDALAPPLPCVAAVNQLCKSRDLLACRAALLEAILGAAVLPEGEPVVAEAEARWNVSAVLPTRLIWNLSTSPVLANHSRQSRVLFYRSASPQRKSDTIVMYNNGHGEHECIPHGNTVPRRINDAGYDVMEHFMPLMSCNKENRLNENVRLSKLSGQGMHLAHSMFEHEKRGHHDWYKWFDENTARSAGKPALRFFVEPLLLAVAHARRQGYTNIVLVGLSGGAWQVLVAASLLANVNLTIPVAGVCRDTALRHPEKQSFHYERTHMEHMVNDRQLYRMAALEPQRAVLQIYHARDECCCRAGRDDWAHVRQMDVHVRNGTAGHMHGHMQTAITDEYEHAMHSSDIEIVLRAVALLRRGHLHPQWLAALPHDELASGIVYNDSRHRRAAQGDTGDREGPPD